MKPRKFATAAAFAVALLVAALAAASVSAATSSQKSTNATKGPGYQEGPWPHWQEQHKGSNVTPQMVGTGRFVPTAPKQPRFHQQSTDAGERQASILTHDRGIPGKLGPKGGASLEAGRPRART